MDNCILCADLTAQTGRKPWNECLLETDHFVVLPSLGALVEGWLLIVPKEHCISMGALPVEWRQEADDLTEQVRNLLHEQYNLPILMFEHGPSAIQHGTGCGVDHAHLHAVPLDCDILSFLEPFVPSSLEWLPADWEERSQAYRTGQDYLYFKQEGSVGQVAVLADFGSQVFRKAIASYLGVLNEFNWRENPQLAIVNRTIEVFNVAAQIDKRGTEHAA